jgi:heat shock protein HslJ
MRGTQARLWRSRPRRVMRWVGMVLVLAGISALPDPAAAQAPDPTTATAQAEICDLTDFDTARVELLLTIDGAGGRVLTVTGNQPFQNMTAKLVGLTYVQQPDFYGIEVQGCRTGEVGLPPAVPYAVSFRFRGTEGKRGIEVIGATRTQRFDLTAPAPPASLAGTSWVLYSPSLGVPAPASISADFNATRVTGSAGCNSYSAGYTIPSAGIDIGAIVTGRRVCASATRQAEQAFLKKLDAVSTFLVIGNSLYLSGGAGMLTFSKVATAVAPVR